MKKMTEETKDDIESLLYEFVVNKIDLDGLKTKIIDQIKEVNEDNKTNYKKELKGIKGYIEEVKGVVDEVKDSLDEKMDNFSKVVVKNQNEITALRKKQKKEFIMLITLVGVNLVLISFMLILFIRGML